MHRLRSGIYAGSQRQCGRGRRRQTHDDVHGGLVALLIAGRRRIGVDSLCAARCQLERTAVLDVAARLNNSESPIVDGRSWRRIRDGDGLHGCVNTGSRSDNRSGDNRSKLGWSGGTAAVITISGISGNHLARPGAGRADIVQGYRYGLIGLRQHDGGRAFEFGLRQVGNAIAIEVSESQNTRAIPAKGLDGHRGAKGSVAVTGKKGRDSVQVSGNDEVGYAVAVKVANNDRREFKAGNRVGHSGLERAIPISNQNVDSLLVVGPIIHNR